MTVVPAAAAPGTGPDRSIPPVRDEASNRAGRARAMTVLTPIRPWAHLPVPGLLRHLLVPGVAATEAVFLYVRASLTGVGDIQKLSFIHFARWGIIRDLPDLGQPAEDLRQPLFMFESNYNGTFEQYIDAFSKVLGPGMRAFWFTSYGFPGPLPVQPFKTYIRSNELVLDHYYCAYPEASATDVVAALDVAPRHRALQAEAPSLAAASFAERLADLLRPPPPPPAPGFPPAQRIARLLRDLARRDPGPGRRSRSGRSAYVVSMTPLRPGTGQTVKAALAAMTTSPFAAVPGVHVGRFLVVDAFTYGWDGAPREQTRLRSDYLLCTAVVTGDGADLPGDLFRALLADPGGAAASAWGHGAGFPGGVDQQIRYLRRSQLDTVLFFASCPAATPADVRGALADCEQLQAFAQRHRADDAAALQAAYVEEAWGR